MTDIRKILILRFSSLGDIIMATPMIRCVRRRFPLAQIDVLVRSDFKDLIVENPHIDRKLFLDRRSGARGLLGMIRALRRESYDLVYDAHRSLRTAAMMPFLGARHRAYYEKHYASRSLALTLKLPLLSDERMLNRYIDPLAAFGVEWDGGGPEVFLSRAARETADRVLADKPEPLVGFIPSAQWPGKRWAPERFRELLGLFVAETTDHVVVLGGPGDRFCADVVAGFPPDRVTNLQGRLSIAESGAVIARCRYVVANDTGLMHLADALSVPSVLVLGPTSREMGCLPFHPASEIVERDLWCRPCSKNGQAPCVRRKRWCLELISAREVFDRSLRLATRLGAA